MVEVNNLLIILYIYLSSCSFIIILKKLIQNFRSDCFIISTKVLHFSYIEFCSIIGRNRVSSKNENMKIWIALHVTWPLCCKWKAFKTMATILNNSKENFTMDFLNICRNIFLIFPVSKLMVLQTDVKYELTDPHRFIYFPFYHIRALIIRSMYVAELAPLWTKLHDYNDTIISYLEIQSPLHQSLAACGFMMK